MVCPSCGADNPENLRFCGQCGCGLQRGSNAPTIAAEAPPLAGPVPMPGLKPVTGQASTRADLNMMATQYMATTDGALQPANFEPGASFATRYRIEMLLGEGGMGAVYKAHDIELDRTVALKLVRPELASNPQTVLRFKQELLLASKISHKNILRIHDLGDWNGIKYITMAFVEGLDLGGLIEKEGPLSFDRALKYTKQLCAALEAAHNEDVVHRDLKPQNILIDRSETIYISDFGLAKSLEPAASNMTRTGQIMGTPQYMSPEQVETTHVDHRSDLYSLGLIVYEMFTGQLPFRAASVMQMMYQQVTEPPKDPRTFSPQLPEYIANVILKCLEKDPANRYQSAREILDDIESQQAPTPTLSMTASALHARRSTDTTAARSAPATISIQLPRPTASWWKLGAAVVALIAGLFAIPGVRHGILGTAGSTEATKPQHYMALLPLKVVGDDTLRYIADGVDDALTAKLAGLKQVYVASANAVNAAVSKQDPQKIARALGVQILVQGTAQSSGDLISISVSMDDVAKNKPLLNKEFKGSKKDLLTLEDQIFAGLVNALLIQQTNEERARTMSRPTQDVDAYDLYLKGRNLLRKQRTAANLDQALKIFNEAIGRDPQFALAYAGTADASQKMWDLTKDGMWIQQALAAAQQAQRIDDTLPEAHSNLGSIYTAMGQTGQATAELKRARELAPNSDEGLRRLGLAYQAAGRQQEAIATFIEATRVNPYLWTNFNALGGAYFKYGENEKALEAFQKVTVLEPDTPNGWANKGAVYYRQANWSACIPLFQKAIELDPKPVYYSQLGVTYFFLGRYAESAKMFETAVEKKPNDSTFRVNLADAYRWSDQGAKAGASYDRAITQAYKDLEVNPKNTTSLGNLAISYAKKSNPNEALKFIRQARQIDPEDNDLMYKEAVIHTLAGRFSEALAILKESLQRGYSLQEAKSDPELKTLREKPEFQQLQGQPSQKQK